MIGAAVDFDTRLSERQEGILRFLESFIAQNGYPPSVREIGEAVGLSSSSTVHSHLNALENKGFIRRDPSSARALTVIGGDGKTHAATAKTSTVITVGEGAATTAPPPHLPRNVVTLPLVGQVAAGTPIFAEQNIEESLILPTQIVGDTGSFLLTVRGESMIEAGIFDGDYVVVKEQPTANNGEIVVALIDDEATVKTFYQEQGHIRLQPENHTMEPICVRNVTILGKVIALLRAL
ncbi:MAG: transcriptional repressor LexA [Coriobacteriales bacterium]|jgi:repressor LexA|nr:transcriptional repressor LexA [Coriobacteriales bacterium]